MLFSNKSKPDLALVMAGCAIILLQVAKPIDAWLVQSLCSILGIAPAQDADNLSIVIQISNYGLLLIYVAAGFICARFLHPAARLIVIPQLLALTAIMVLPFYRQLVPALQPLSYVSGGILGFAFGLMSLRISQASERANTQEVGSSLLNRRLLETRLQLVKQDEIERKMLAADLHDQVLNDMKLLLKLLEEKKGEIAESLLTDLSNRIEIAMEGIRKVMESLCPSDLEHIGLLAALEDCLKNSAGKSGFLPQFRSNISEEQLQPLKRIEKALLYRLVQESITNICKHAKASKVRLSVDIQDGELLLKIVDDGVGLKSSTSNTKSRGLQYMKLRAEIVGARINWHPGADGKGTAVEIRLNLSGR